MNYENYIKGKNVVFVGASPIEKGREKGIVIDNAYDVVVKTNGSVFLNCDDYYRDYGKRIDVLYTNHQFYREMSPFPLDEWKSRGIKYLRMKVCSDLYDINKFINAEIIIKSIKEVNEFLTGATMGAYIFNDILRCNPMSLTVHGIDFFASKKKVFENDNYGEYVNGYLPDKIRVQGNKINVGKKEDGHNFYTNADYIYKLYQEYDNFLMPDYIESILKSIVNREIDQL